MFDLRAYQFELPESLIAQTPVEPRDSSRLLVLDRASARIEHVRFSDLPRYLDARDLLIANNSKVIRARLVGKRRGAGGGRFEFLLLERKGPRAWLGIYHASARAKPGMQFEIPANSGSGGLLVGTVSEVPTRDTDAGAIGAVIVEFDRDPETSGFGEVPLPPYIRPDDPRSLENRYQTTYASVPGSAAAPTAGLHFTPELRQRLASNGVRWAEVTLHVGVGTFRPVKTVDIREHRMHFENYWIPERTAECVKAAKQSGSSTRVVAVGTTSARVLEGAWRDPPHEALLSGFGKTDLFLHPGVRGPGISPFRVVDRMITNFHLPGSTLFILVCAFAGTELVQRAYREAIEERYRFYSFGDAMLII